MSDAEGLFRIAALPGRGVLMIYGPNNDYIFQEKGANELYNNGQGGRRFYAHAFVPIDIKAEGEPTEITISLMRGVTVRGQLVGPDDRPITEASMLSRLCVSESANAFTWGTSVVLRDGQFELHGLDPEKSVPVYFLDAKNELGSTVEISGKSAQKQPLVVHLSPCGKAVARFVDPDGKPLVKYEPGLHIVVTPGPLLYSNKRARNKLAADADFVVNFDREHYFKGSVTDDQGRCTFPALIPGATYRITIFRDDFDWGEKDFTVKSGETLDLGDIVIKQSE